MWWGVPVEQGTLKENNDFKISEKESDYILLPY